MNFAGMFKRDRSLNQAFVDLEEDMGEMLHDALETAVVTPSRQGDAYEPAHADHDHAVIEDNESLTSYAQQRIASLSAFEDMYGEAGENLRTISEALARVSTVHHLTREFLGSVHAGIHRNNEIELTNQRLISENNRLRRQAEMVKKLRGQHEALIEGTKRREAKAQQDIETLREAVASARFETIETKSTIAQIEAERAELMNGLAARSADADRLGREAEILRERQVNLSADLDAAVKRNADLQRRYDELSAVHQSESGQLSDLRSKLAVAESEFFRIQKQNDGFELKIADAEEALRMLEREMDDVAARHSSEMQALRSENEALRAKIAVAATAKADSAAEIGALRHQLRDSETELRIARDKIEMLRTEAEGDRQAMLTNSADVSKFNLRQASDQITIDRQSQEIEELKEQLAAANGTVKRLSSYERFYQSVKNRQCEKARDGAAAIEATRSEGEEQDAPLPMRASA